jgi:hypothetical protein
MTDSNPTNDLNGLPSINSGPEPAEGNFLNDLNKFNPTEN